MATLPLQSQMSLSTSYNHTARHRLVEFGDGYIQRTPIGIHGGRRVITVNHDNLDTTDASTMITFYEARMGDGAVVDIASNAPSTITIGSFQFI